MCTHGHNEYDPCDICDKIPTPKHDATATKSAQVAAIRQRCEDIMAGAVYAEDVEESLFQALNDVFNVSVRKEDRPAIEIDSYAPDILAAWLWERGVRA
jgi:hypothetical protein